MSPSAAEAGPPKPVTTKPGTSPSVNPGEVDPHLPIGATSESGAFPADDAPGDLFMLLEDRVHRLVASARDSLRERASLRDELARNEERIRALEEEVRRLNQRRQDVAKRLDDLIGRVGQLDAGVVARLADPSRQEAGAAE